MFLQLGANFVVFGGFILTLECRLAGGSQGPDECMPVC